MKNEQIVCLNTLELKTKIDIHMEKIKLTETEVKSITEGLHYDFIERSSAESDFSYKQIIPYCIVVNENDEILTYKRKGSEKRLHGLHSAGIGGHINSCDAGDSLYETIFNGAVRELKEELPGISNYTLTCAGLINEEYSDVGKVHTGIVFRADVNSKFVIGYDDEVSDYQWIKKDDIDKFQFELWSKLALDIIEEKKRKMFLVFSHKITEEQIVEGKSRYCIEEFMYLPDDLQKCWSGLRPEGSLDMIALDKIIEWLKNSAKKDDLVLIQGDFGAVYTMVGFCEKNGLIPVYSTTHRDSIERMGCDGKIEKIHFFRHVGFRRYK